MNNVGFVRRSRAMTACALSRVSQALPGHRLLLSDLLKHDEILACNVLKVLHFYQSRRLEPRGKLLPRREREKKKRWSVGVSKPLLKKKNRGCKVAQLRVWRVMLMPAERRDATNGPGKWFSADCREGTCRCRLPGSCFNE